METKKVGESVPAPSEEITEDKEIEEQTPEETPEPEPQPDLPDKFRGKSQGDIVRMYQELESHYGNQARELGDLRNENAYYQNVFRQAQQGQPQQPMQTPVPQEEFDWENPDKAIDKKLERRLADFSKQLLMEQANFAAPQAKRTAIMQNPGLFKGIEDQVENLVREGVQRGWFHPLAATSPETYTRAAWQLRGELDNYRMPTGGVNPVKPTGTEVPGGARHSESDEGSTAEFSPLGKELIRNLAPDKTEKEIAELMEKDRRRGY